MSVRQMMNFSRVLLASGSHLMKRASTMVVTPALTGVNSCHLLKRACTTVSASVSADLLATSDGALVSAKVSTSTMQRKKRKIFEKLLSLKETGGTVKETGGTVVETLNEIMMREEEEGVSITQSDIARWAKRLYKDGKHRQALEMFEWMERKKMTFSPSELEIFVELLGKMDGYEAARDLFNKVHPNFDNMNRCEKNFPA